MYAYASHTRGPHVVLEVLTHMYIYPAVDAEIYQVHSCILTPITKEEENKHHTARADAGEQEE